MQALRWKSQRIQSQNLVLTPIIHYHQHCSVTTTLTVSWAPLQSSLSSQLCLCSRVSGPSCSFTPKKRENSSSCDSNWAFFFQSSKCHSISTNLWNFPIPSWKGVFSFLVLSSAQQGQVKVLWFASNKNLSSLVYVKCGNLPNLQGRSAFQVKELKVSHVLKGGSSSSPQVSSFISSPSCSVFSFTLSG